MSRIGDVRMMPTITIHGSGGEVFVPFGGMGIFIRGKRFEVKVTGLSSDPNIPLEVREEMVGLIFSAVLTGKQVIEQCGGSRFASLEGASLAYARDVCEHLEKLGKSALANKIRALSPNDKDMWVFEKGTFEVVT